MVEGRRWAAIRSTRPAHSSAERKWRWMNRVRSRLGTRWTRGWDAIQAGSASAAKGGRLSAIGGSRKRKSGLLLSLAARNASAVASVVAIVIKASQKCHPEIGRAHL